MILDDRVLDRQEIISYRLRSLYYGHHYDRYRMSKFEEYDLYSRNKDFLFSEGVITFTDTNGRLMALKPDVTLSIVKNGKDTPGQLRKMYYQENVYRVSAVTDGFREQTQVGLECTGAVDRACVGEVLTLAAESLKLCARDTVLVVSHIGLLSSIIERIAPDAEIRDRILQLAGEKNLHGIAQVCREAGVREGAEAPLIRLLGLHGSPGKVMDSVMTIARENECGELAEELAQAFDSCSLQDRKEKMIVDFSTVADMRYYNGVVFRGFISGIPGSVLSGGQYDALMKRMGRKDRAIGFAVFLNMMERIGEGETDA